MSGLGGRRVLVTGATGFIGGHMLRRLHELEADCVAVVRPDGAELRAGHYFESADLSSERDARAVVRAADPQIILNFAGYGIARDQRDPETARVINGLLPGWLADELARLPGSDRRFLHMGSAAEYGAETGDLVEDGPASPIGLYGQTKLEGTRRVADVGRAEGVDAVTLRLFTVYGAGEPDARLVPTLVKARDREGRIPLTQGLQPRDFTHVRDVIDGIMRALEAGRAPGPVVNLASGVLVTVREFVERTAAVLGIRADRLGFGDLPGRSDEMTHQPVNNRRCRGWLGWVPETTIEDGIARTLRDLA